MSWQETEGSAKRRHLPLWDVERFPLMNSVFPAGIIYYPKRKDELRVKSIRRKQLPKLRHTGIPHTYQCEKCNQEFYVKRRTLVLIREFVGEQRIQSAFARGGGDN